MAVLIGLLRSLVLSTLASPITVLSKVCQVLSPRRYWPDVPDVGKSSPLLLALKDPLLLCSCNKKSLRIVPHTPLSCPTIGNLVAITDVNYDSQLY